MLAYIGEAIRVKNPWLSNDHEGKNKKSAVLFKTSNQASISFLESFKLLHCLYWRNKLISDFIARCEP